MTKDVELSILGLQLGEDETSDNVESVVEAAYYKKNNSHYLLYEEKVDGFSEVSKSRVMFKADLVEVTRQGPVEAHMIFEENKKHPTKYKTPYGVLLLTIHTQSVRVEEQEDCIGVFVKYVLEIEESPLSQNEIVLQIRSKI